MIVFTPNGDSPNRLERLAFYAGQAGDTETVEFAEREFYRSGSEDDCYHDDSG